MSRFAAPRPSRPCRPEAVREAGASREGGPTIHFFVNLQKWNELQKSYDSYRVFRGEEYLWFQVAESSHDTFMIRTRSRG